MPEVTRQSIDEALSREKWQEAFYGLRHLFAAAPDLATAQFVLDRLARMPHPLNPVPCRLYILRSFTLEPVIPLLRAVALLQGIALTIKLGDFNAYAQEIIDPHSQLYQFDPHAVFLAVQTRDLTPELWERFTNLSPAAVKNEVRRAESELAGWIESFRSRHKASLVIHNFERPLVPRAGILDLQHPEGQVESIQALNQSLSCAAAAHPGVYVLDYDGLVARFGRERWCDERKWLTMRMPIAADALIHLVNEYLRFLLPLNGRVAKALVVDLDNTLWGGVVGEDGPQGVKLGPEYPGAAFVALQQAILDLRRRGILLAVCSKNNPADALEVLEKHPSMLLRPPDFASLRINWDDKVRNLCEIARELNIGTDALAFLDDNPTERERVRLEMPEVWVLDMPADPMLFASTVQGCPAFERLALSEEDRDRGRYYSDDRQRRELQQNSGSLEDFYRSLDLEAEIAEVSPASLPRAAQLTQKTNQFNLTTRRYTEQQIAEFRHDPLWHVFTLRARDRFGDNGLVGLALTRRQGDAMEIDTFLLSCRVIGRTLETALLAHLAHVAAKEGATVLRGKFIPTKKNAPACHFYSSHGFRQVDESGEATTWEYALQGERLACPEWIRLTILEGETR